MSIFNLNNWFNFFTGKNKTAKKLKDGDIIAFGRKDQKSFNGFRPLAITAKDLKTELGGAAAVDNPNVPIKTYIARILNAGIGLAPIVQAEIVNEGFTQAFQIPINNAPNNGRILINSLLCEFTTDKTFVTAFIVNNNPVTGIPGAVVTSDLLGACSVELDMFDATGARQDFLEVLVKIEVYA